MEESCTCPRGPSRCTAWTSHTSHRLRSDQCVSARRNVKRGIGALTPARSSSPRLDAVLVAPLLIGIAAVATVLIAPTRRWLAETDEVVGLARGPVAVRAFVSGGSARPDKVLGSAPRLGLQVILSRSSPWRQMQEQRASRCNGDAVLTSPIQTVPAPAALARSSTCCCSAALVTVARCPPSLSQLASASYQVAGASKKVNSCPSSLSET